MRLSFVALIAGCILSAPTFALDKFDTEATAQKHCPQDTVVWLNIPTMIWHISGERWYGTTKKGAFVCEAEAAAEGARGSHNGQ